MATFAKRKSDAAIEIDLSQQGVVGLYSETDIWVIIGQAAPRFVFGNLSDLRDCRFGGDTLVF